MVIRANKPPELRVIISAVEIIQPCLGVVIIPPVAEGILFAHGVAAGVGDGALALTRQNDRTLFPPYDSRWNAI